MSRMNKIRKSLLTMAMNETNAKIRRLDEKIALKAAQRKRAASGESLLQGDLTADGRRPPTRPPGISAATRRAAAAAARVERFDRRGTEPFEPFEPFELFQNSGIFL